MVAENGASNPSGARVHYQSVVRAGSGVLRPIVPFTLALPSDHGAPLLIGLSVDESCPSLALCSDMQMPVVYGFMTALQNPLRILEFASASSANRIHRDNFLVLQQFAALLFIARGWSGRCLNIPGAFDDADRAVNLTMRPSQWATIALGQLSGQPSDSSVKLPVEVHQDLQKLAKLGYRLQNRWHAHELVKASEAPKSAPPSPAAPPAPTGHERSNGAKRGRPRSSDPEGDSRHIEAMERLGLGPKKYVDGGHAGEDVTYEQMRNLRAKVREAKKRNAAKKLRK